MQGLTCVHDLHNQPSFCPTSNSIVATPTCVPLRLRAVLRADVFEVLPFVFVHHVILNLLIVVVRYELHRTFPLFDIESDGLPEPF